MHEDYIWFEEHYEEFKKRYGDAFLVIKDKKVIGVYDSYASGVRVTEKTEQLGAFIVQQCLADRPAYVASFTRDYFS